MKALISRIAHSVLRHRPGEPSIVVAAFDAAVEHFAAGRMPDAQHACEMVLASDPGHAPAMYLLGKVLLRAGDTAHAVEFIERAVAADSSNAIATATLGALYHRLQRFDEAEDMLLRAIRSDPALADAHNSLGILHCSRGQIAQGEASFRRAAELNPADALAFVNLAKALAEQGKLSDSEEYYRRAQMLAPARADIYNNLGTLLQQQSRFDEAEVAYRDAIDLAPGYAAAYCNLGANFRAQARIADAAENFRKATELDPNMHVAWSNLGEALLAGHQLDEAETCCRRAVALAPKFPMALANLGAVLNATGRSEEAETCFRSALQADPRCSPARSGLGAVLSARGLFGDAEANFREGLRLNPDDAAMKFNLATRLLSRGDYADGLPLYESRFATFAMHSANLRGSYATFKELPVWTGQDLRGKRLVVWTEQGLGDSVMAMRFLPLLERLGALSVTVVCEEPLERLFSAVCSSIHIVREHAKMNPGEFDLHCPMLSLPLAFAARLDSIPGDVPYAVVPASIREGWRTRLATTTGLKVGFAWAGGPGLRDDAKRSISLAALEPLLGTEGIQSVSLQKGPAAAEMARVGKHAGNPMIDWMDECGDLLVTGGLIANLDLVITVDTVIAHLAGALGTPTWLLNRFDGDWRWGESGVTSAWYPSMQIFRQHRPGDWSGPLRAVADQLAELLSTRTIASAGR